MEPLMNKKANGAQKFVAWGIIGALIMGGMYVFNHFIAPNLIWFLNNIWAIIIPGAPLVAITLYTLFNPLVVWGFFKTLSVKFTAFLVKMDPLSVMDRYIDWLGMKLQNIRRTIETVNGEKISLDRQLGEYDKQIQQHLRNASAALQLGDKLNASLLGSKVSTLRNSVKVLTPLQQKAEKSLKLLRTVEENWAYAKEKLAFEVENKRIEYRIISRTVKGLKSADDFINSDNEAAKLYGMGVRELEERVTQGYGYIEEFDRRSKDIIAGISIEKQANMDEGLRELETYMKGGKLLIPVDDIVQLNTDKIPEAQVIKLNLLNK
jgi:hypothetical protein